VSARYVRLTVHGASGYTGNWVSILEFRLFGDTVVGVPDQAPPLPIALGQNYPNPFNPTTTVPFTTERDDYVTLHVYDSSGRLVRTLVDRRLQAGPHREVWNGRDQDGNPVASGVYFYRLRSGGRSLTRKAVVLK
jgi:hypothetical protein